MERWQAIEKFENYLREINPVHQGDIFRLFVDILDEHAKAEYNLGYDRGWDRGFKEGHGRGYDIATADETPNIFRSED